MKRKKWMILGLSLLLACTPAMPVFADDPAAIDESDLEEVRNSIDELEEQKQDLLSEIDDLKLQLVTTISQMDGVDRQISDLEADMRATDLDLQQAESDREVQYEAMKLRIQYLYESGGEAGWAAVFLAGGNISTILDKAQYTQQMYEYDRQQLETYMETVEKVESLQAQQRSQRSQLEQSKKSLQEGQERLEGLLAEAREEYDDYDAELQDAYALAEAYRILIDQQNEMIARMIMEQAAAEEAAAAAAAAESYAYTDYDAGYTDYIGGADYTDAYGTYEDYSGYTGEDYTGGDYTDYSDAGTTTHARNTTPISEGTSTASGQALLEYAQQFLGNSYVYGGNSLTDGVDCSGFVQQVYANFGVNTSRTSYDMENDGTAVSYNDVQIGDVVVYDGHVGIYAGDNQIINAIDEANGIGYSDVNYSEILSIRRYFDE